MIKRLSQYNNTLKEFVKFYIDNYGKIDTFALLPNVCQIALILQFLDIKGLGIHADRYSYVVYYSTTDDVKFKERVMNRMKANNSIFIFEQFNNKEAKLFVNFEEAIVKCFEFLEIPF
jgi:hypothetical protein